MVASAGLSLLSPLLSICWLLHALHVGSFGHRLPGAHLCITMAYGRISQSGQQSGAISLRTAPVAAKAWTQIPRKKASELSVGMFGGS